MMLTQVAKSMHCEQYAGGLGAGCYPPWLSPSCVDPSMSPYSLARWGVGGCLYPYQWQAFSARCSHVAPSVNRCHQLYRACFVTRRCAPDLFAVTVAALCPQHLPCFALPNLSGTDTATNCFDCVCRITWYKNNGAITFKPVRPTWAQTSKGNHVLQK
jgi:hypothetical protein